PPTLSSAAHPLQTGNGPCILSKMAARNPGQYIEPLGFRGLASPNMTATGGGPMRYGSVLCVLISGIQLLHSDTFVLSFDEFFLDNLGDVLNLVVKKNGQELADRQACEVPAQNPDGCFILGGGPPLTYTLGLAAGTIQNNAMGISYLTEPGDAS